MCNYSPINSQQFIATEPIPQLKNRVDVRSIEVIFEKNMNGCITSNIEMKKKG